MSNRGQRPRIHGTPRMLPGGQYAAGLIILLQHGLERIRRIERISPMVDVRQKHKKPLALDARCLLRAIDAVPV